MGVLHLSGKREEWMNTTEAATLARRLMNEHGLRDWTFQYDRSKRRFGQCRYSSKEIGLSPALTYKNTEEIVKDVILHEIAHALVGPDVPSHGDEWQAKCVEIGARPQARYDTKEVEGVQPNYYLTCLNCGLETPRFRKTNKRRSCGRCSRTFDERFLLVYRNA